MFRRTFHRGIQNRFLCLLRHFSARSVTALTGVQPTGTPHLGNYLGMIKPCMELQKSGNLSALLVMIADLHALTSSAAPDLHSTNMELGATLVACFLEGPAVNAACQPTLFLQSAARGHTDLAWILANACTMPRLSHLPQWRDKSGIASVKQTTSVQDDLNSPGYPSSDLSELLQTMESSCSVGLFTYPVLQAADILLYGADIVPIGSDQIAHIELARDMVRSATAKWKNLRDLLVMPTGLTLGVPKINSLRNPLKKMSKSDPSDDGTIYLTDPPDVIRRKVKRSVTDSIRAVTYDAEHRPGLSNLLRIWAAVEERELDEICCRAGQLDKESLKSSVIDSLVQHVVPLGKRIETLKGTIEGRQTVKRILLDGSAVASRIAVERLDAVYSAIGCGLSSFDAVPHSRETSSV